MAMGYFDHQQFISAATQLTTVPPTITKNDLLAGLQDGSIIQFGAQYAYPTQIVYVGIDINEFRDIDVDKEHTYLADFYIWFRYQGNLAMDSIMFENSVDASGLGVPLAAKDFGNTHYRLYRIRSTFSNSFDLRNYPFDRQWLTIELRHVSRERHSLLFVVDLLGLGDVTTQANILQNLNRAHVFESINEWQPVNGLYHTETVHEYTTRGDPAHFGNKADIQRSQFYAGIEIQRDVIRFTSKTMLPVFFIIALAYLGLFLPNQEFETITGIMTGTVLSVVFFHVDLSGRLNVGYTVALDYAFYVIYALLAIELMISIIAWHRSVKDKGNSVMVVRLFWLMRILYPTVLIGGSLWMAVVYNVLPIAH
jgi:branched-chain amino acid transport system substrate-binding protein